MDTARLMWLSIGMQSMLLIYALASYLETPTETMRYLILVPLMILPTNLIYLLLARLKPKEEREVNPPE